MCIHVNTYTTMQKLRIIAFKGSRFLWFWLVGAVFVQYFCSFCFNDKYNIQTTFWLNVTRSLTERLFAWQIFWLVIIFSINSFLLNWTAGYRHENISQQTTFDNEEMPFKRFNIIHHMNLRKKYQHVDKKYQS